MKLIAVLLIASICLNVCSANAFTDIFKKFGEGLKESFTQVGGKLKEVGGALKDVAVDKAKGLFSQALQATAGAVIESFKGLDIGKTLFGLVGKRETEEVGVLSFAKSLFEETKMILEETFHNTFARFAHVLENLHTYPSVEEVHDDLSEIHSEHKVAVRGILGDSLNRLIDGARKLWSTSKALLGRARDALFGDKKPETADPVMVGRRELLADAWHLLSSKVADLKQMIAPKVERVAEIASNVTAALKHHTGKMFNHVKDSAVSKVKEALGYLSNELQTHVQKAKDTFKSVKDDLAEIVAGIMQ